MAEIKTIKDVDDKTWMEFKHIARKHNVKLGTLFKSLVRNYEQRNASWWNTILNHEKILSDKEAEEFEIVTKRMRAEGGFRI